MAFPHPKTGKDHCWHEDKPSRVGVLWNSVKRTVNGTEYRNAKDDVNPAKNRTLLGDLCFHDQVSFSMATLFAARDYSFQATDKLFPAGVRALIGGLLVGTETRLLHAHERSAPYRNQRPDHTPERGPIRVIVLRAPRFTPLEPPSAAIWAFQYRTVLRTRRSAAASRRTSWHRCRRCVQSDHPRGAAQGRRSRCASPRRPTR
jgi:hypothetical protein